MRRRPLHQSAALDISLRVAAVLRVVSYMQSSMLAVPLWLMAGTRVIVLASLLPMTQRSWKQCAAGCVQGVEGGQAGQGGACGEADFAAVG